MQTHTKTLSLAVLAAAATTVVVAEDAPKNSWETSANANLGLSSGNSKNFIVNSGILSVKKWDKNELTGTADVNYGENTTFAPNAAHTAIVESKTTTAQSYGAGLQYNRLVWEDRGYFLAKGDARQDKVAGVDHRFTLAPGLGYYLIREKAMELKAEVGPGFVFEKLKGLPEKNYVTLRVAEAFKWNITEHARLFQDLEYLPQVDRFGNYVANASVKVEADITTSLALNITLRDTYRSKPAPYDVLPVVFRKKNDLTLTAGVTYKF